MTEIELYVKSYFDVENKDVSKIAELFKPTQIKKGDYFMKLGGKSKGLSFVQNGFLRMYGYDPNDEKEVTQWICTTGTFVTELSSLIFETPSRWNIQALTDCELYAISHHDYQRIGELIPNWVSLEKLFISKCFVAMENRIFSHLSMSAEERYNMLFEQNSELFNQVPQQHIASMLGMTPETFSRIRKKKIL